MTTTVPTYEAIIVLGYDISADGILPQEGINRVEKAVDLYEQGLSKTIIFSGAVSYSHDFQPSRTEASAMADLAIAQGIPAGAIIVEAQARNTRENATYSLLLVAVHSWHRLLILTGDFHLQRTAYIFRKVYGSSYALDFAATDNGLNPSDLARMKDLETQKWQALQARSG